MLLVFETKNIDRDSGFVPAHTNSKKLSAFSIGIFYCVKDKKYLAKTYGKKLGKASVTGYCIRFKAL
ncbi:MAG: hypothetical protein ACLPKT_15240, partial [Methylocella sp.]